MTPEEQWQSDLAAQRAEYTQETVHHYRAEVAGTLALCAGVAAAVAAFTAAGGVVSAAWLATVPAYKTLAQSLTAGFARASVRSEATVRVFLERAAQDADSYFRRAEFPAQPRSVAAAAVPGPRHAAGHVPGKALEVWRPTRAELELVVRARLAVAENALQGRRTPEVLALQRGRLLKELTAAARTEGAPTKALELAVSRRTSAAASHTLAVLNTETADVGRALVAEAIGDDGHWQWLTREDGNVCDQCAENNGQLFPASALFEVFHRNCRCIAVPVA